MEKVRSVQLAQAGHGLVDVEADKVLLEERLDALLQRLHGSKGVSTTLAPMGKRWRREKEGIRAPNIIPDCTIVAPDAGEAGNGELASQKRVGKNESIARG